MRVRPSASEAKVTQTATQKMAFILRATTKWEFVGKVKVINDYIPLLLAYLYRSVLEDG